MSRLVSIECDPNEIRIAVGSTGLTGISVEHVLSAPLSLDDKEELLTSPKTNAAIQSLLKQANVRSGNVIFCIGRSNIELRALTLPTTDRNELPDMVRFAAQRQFANAGDSWPIDYIVMPSQLSTSTDCMAASISPVVLDRLSKIAESAGLTLSSVVLRPMTSATMAVAKQPSLANSPILMLELFEDEADMAVLDQGVVVFMRNVRFSQSIESPTSLPAVIGEIKRTLIAAASQRANLNIDQVRIWGSLAQQGERCETLSQSLGINTEAIDPFELLDVSATVRAQSGALSGKYASTLGALMSPQLADKLIDFSNPRKRKEKEKPFVKYAIAGGIAATLIVGGYVWQSSQHAVLDAEIKGLNAAIKLNDESLALSNKKLADWNKVDAFLQGDRQWLDELEYLSQHAANADRAIFGQTTFIADPKNATITTKFITAKQDDVPVFLDALRDPQHVVQNRSVLPNPDKSSVFPVAADVTLRLGPPKSVDPRTAGKGFKPTEPVVIESNTPPSKPESNTDVEPTTVATPGVESTPTNPSPASAPTGTPVSPPPEVPPAPAEISPAPAEVPPAPASGEGA